MHHDTHDVLVLQVAGEKRWLLYEPLLELPLKHQRYSPALGAHGQPTDDLVLRAGDTLYLPRGWLHQAETSTTDSLHLTIGIAAHTWLDAVKDARSRRARRSSRSGAVSETARRTASPTSWPSNWSQCGWSNAAGDGSSTRAVPFSKTGSQLSALERLDARTRLERRRR